MYRPCLAQLDYLANSYIYAVPEKKLQQCERAVFVVGFFGVRVFDFLHNISPHKTGQSGTSTLESNNFNSLFFRKVKFNCYECTRLYKWLSSILLIIVTSATVG